MVDNGNDWTSVFLDTDLSFGTIRSMEVTMMANIKDEFEKLSRIGEGNGFYQFPVNCIMYFFFVIAVSTIYLFSFSLAL